MYRCVLRTQIGSHSEQTQFPFEADHYSHLLYQPSYNHVKML